MPAGRRWQEAVRTTRVRGIMAAEIQSPEPAAVATRWSELLDIAVAPDDAGRPTVALDHGTIRFVDATDGRGEGLGGIDLVAVDADAVLAAADERGVRRDDGVVLLGGVRFRLVEG
jgi:hypothetical protein